MPYVSTEALVGAGLVVLLAFGYQHITSTSTATDNAAGTTGAAKKKNKNKKKKSAGAGAGASHADSPSIGVSEADSDVPQAKGKGNGKKNVAPVPVAVAAKAAPTPSPEPEAAPPTSFAAAAGGASSPTPPRKPKLLAEKLLPKPRKTVVDEWVMLTVALWDQLTLSKLEPEDRPPQIARVMKIIPAQGPSPPMHQRIEKFADDYAESSDPAWSDSDSATPSAQASVPRKSANDGWNVVAAKKSEPAHR